MTAFIACPTTDNPPCVPGSYQVEPPTEDAPAAYAAALARHEGAQAMLTALQQAGVKVPLPVFNAVALPLLRELSAQSRAVINNALADFRANQPLNEARLIAECT
jgi:hypothetical protein